MKLIWSPLAIERLSEIALYIAHDNLSAANKWVEDLFDRVGQLEQFPDSGRHVPEYPTRDDLREIIYMGRRIIYKIHGAGVDILTNQAWAADATARRD